MYRLLLLFSFVSLLLPRIAGCQSAESLLRKAMTANGHWENIRAFDYATHRTNYNRWQGYRFDRVQPEQDEYEVYVDLEHRRHWHHTLAHYAGGYVFNTMRINRDAGYYVYDLGLWRTGKALLKVPGDLGEVNRRIILSSFPYFILKEVLDSGDSLQLQTTHSGMMVRRLTGTGIQELRFQPKTLLLASNKVITGNSVKEQYFDAYTHIGALYSLPGKMVLRQNGEDILIDELVRFLPLAAADTARFSLPADYTLQIDTTLPLRARAIARDVYLVEKVDGDRNILFMNMDDQVLLTEAPVSGRVTRGIIDLIHQTLPGKKIGYVHLSHFHNDHIAGIGELVKEGAVVICTPSMEKPVGEMTGESAPKFSFFNGHKVLEDAHHRIEFFEVPNSHAQGLSFLYLPAEKLIYQGDLLSMPEDAVVTPAFKVSQEFYQYLKKHNITYKQIIGHHGLAMITPSLFQRAIDAGRQ